MKNETNIKIPKKYQPMIDEIDRDSDGYWAYSTPGFHFEGMGGDCHTAHEDTQKDLLAMIRTLKPCNCDDCKLEIEKKQAKAEIAATEEAKEIPAEPKKAPKLSKTMQKVMDQLNNAEHYYKVAGLKGGLTFHNDKGRLTIGHEKAWIYHDGMFGVREDTKTLGALEKRGLIKLHKAGGDCCDVIEVIGKQVHEPLTKAVKINVHRKWDEKFGYSDQNLTEFMDSATTTIEEIEKMYSEKFPNSTWTVTVIGEVELTRWDYRK